MVQFLKAPGSVNLKTGLMTHVVAGYPSLLASEKLVLLMAEMGVSLIEIQIPFSDAIADGPVIMGANHAALEQNINPGTCMELINRLAEKITTPIIVMTYSNIPYRFGIDSFVKQCAESGARGIIIPDLVFNTEGEIYLNACREHNLCPVMVVSPNMAQTRLAQVVKYSEGLIYTTLKVGTTGTGKSISSRGRDFLKILKKHTDLPIAAGFGVSNPKHVSMLKGESDYIVIGSAIIKKVEQRGIKGVRDFLTSCNQALKD